MVQLQPEPNSISIGKFRRNGNRNIPSWERQNGWRKKGEHSKTRSLCTNQKEDEFVKMNEQIEDDVQDKGGEAKKKGKGVYK